MPNSSANLAGRRRLRPACLGFIWLALLVAFGFVAPGPARAATIQVPAGGNFQAALDAAQPGDTIELAAGATFVGPFTLRNKGAATAWITIRTSTPDASLPASDRRITPAYAHLLPKVVSPGFDPALQTESGAHHYRIIGVEFRSVNSAVTVFDLVRLGDSGANQDAADEVPHHLVIDRCYLRAFPDQGLKRGLQLNSASTDVLNSYFEGFKTIGQDAQAAGGWNGPGPFKIINNYLEGAGQNMIFGGKDPDINGLVPSDIEIRNNHFFKPPSWKNPLVPPVAGVAASLQPDANSTLAAGTRYYYRVCAQFNGFNGEPCTPATTTEVSQVAAAGQAIRISWSAWSHNPYTAARYFVQRTTDAPDHWPGRDWKWYASVTSLSFTDSGQASVPNLFVIEAQWGVKNIFELKNARRVVVEGNVFEYNWGHGQTGEAILFTVRNQDGTAPWSTVEDVLFRGNIVGHVGGVFNILGHDYNHQSQQAKRITIRDNVCYDVDGATWSGHGELLLMTGNAADIVIDHNTVFHTGSITRLDDDPHTGFVFTNNIMAHNEFGVFGNGVASGTTALSRYTPGYVFRRNLIAGGNPNAYPPDNYFVTDAQFDAQFVNRAAGNYRLAPTSCGSMASNCNPRGGTDGKDVGADIDAVATATAGAVTGIVYARTNVAHAANGGVASASSTHPSGNYPLTAVNNGDRRGTGWGAGGGWNDGTINSYPDWVQVEFNGSKTIDEVSVFTLQDNYANPAEPTEFMNFSLNGITAFEVQYWNGSAWVTVPGGAVTGNNKVWRRFTFAPVTTTKVRVLVAASLDQWSRVTEIEAWLARSNHARASNGATASASSTHASGNFPTAGTINGDRRGTGWGAGGGWNDGNEHSFPDWLEVSFPGAKTVDEVSVFTKQDAFTSPVEPNEAMTFALYGLRDFEVQYWNGSAWVTVGSVMGNNKVWRRFTFAPVTTTKIRVLVTFGLDGYSRITEVEAWGPS